MLRHKGESLIKFILKMIGDNKIRFYHFGDGNLIGKRLLNYGPYDRSKIVDILREHKIDVILLLSTWPETFSYTLSESIAAGIPPIVTNMGALKERLDQQDIGWVVDYDNPEEICRLLRFLRKNRGEIETRRERIKGVYLKSMDEMEKDYSDVYQSALLKGGKVKRFWQKWKQKLFNR
jgi:glycosyltransferase involved in cell wall biosynthesis